MALDGPALQSSSGQLSGPGFVAAAGAWGTALDHRWRDALVVGPCLGPFTSALAAADVADVVHALGIGRVDLYGDSYGSWFAQVLRHPLPDHPLGGPRLDDPPP